MADTFTINLTQNPLDAAVLEEDITLKRLISGKVILLLGAPGAGEILNERMMRRYVTINRLCQLQAKEQLQRLLLRDSMQYIFLLETCFGKKVSQ